MLPAEYQVMAEVEDTHWWYCGLRDLLNRLIRKNFPIGLGPLNILDAGCGTGANLRMLSELFRDSYVGGFDCSPSALAFAKEKAPLADTYQADLCRPEFHCEQFDLVISCDAIYVPGIAACFAGLQMITQRLKSGGILILHLPAYQWLFSEHDQAVGTTERYTAKRVVKLTEELGLQCEKISYRLCHLFPPLVVKRSPQWIWKRTVPAPRSELSLPLPWVNRVLGATLRIENRSIAAGAVFPFGSSIIALARKP
jgi:SAM-dependent methyltransferase